MRVDIKSGKKTVQYGQLSCGEVFCVESAGDHAIWYMSLGNGNHLDLRDGRMYSDKLFGTRELIPGKLTGITVEV